MDGFIPEEQMSAFEDMEMVVTTDEMGYPFDLKPGMQLEDGSIRVEVNSGPMTINMLTNITNRKVEALETVTTTAGTYECLKISQDISGKVGFVKFSASSREWLAENIGTIRSKTLDKKGKVKQITELVKISK